MAARGIPLVEDAAESLGASRDGRAAGSFGRAAALSFNGNKIMTTSGGGMLLSDDASLVARARYLSTQARQPVPWYEHTEVGFNFRLSNLLAALGRVAAVPPRRDDRCDDARTETGMRRASPTCPTCGCSVAAPHPATTTTTAG